VNRAKRAIIVTAIAALAAVGGCAAAPEASGATVTAKAAAGPGFPNPRCNGNPNWYRIVLFATGGQWRCYVYPRSVPGGGGPF
jgi:hypothetical protein